MVRSEELTDKLVADLHFHGYKHVHKGDLFGGGGDATSPVASRFLSTLGIDPEASMYHGGTVDNANMREHICRYVDDVLLDLFFRTHDFKEIVFPKGFCYEQITRDGIRHPEGSVSIDLSNIYDRCTFVNNMWRLFTVDSKHTICKSFHCEGFTGNITCAGERQYSPAEEWVSVLTDDGRYPFHKDFELYLEEHHPGRAVVNPRLRTLEISEFFSFIKDMMRGPFDFVRDKTQFAISAFTAFLKGYRQIADSHIFGDYTIEDLLIIYCALTDKLLLHEESLLLPLLYCIEDIEKTFLTELRDFEYAYTDYHVLDAFIRSKDLFLRFTSREKSKAFKLTYISDTMETIQMFGQKPVCLVFLCNTMPLPYLYDDLRLT